MAEYDIEGKTLRVVERDGDRILFEEVNDEYPSGDYVLIEAEGFDGPTPPALLVRQLVPKGKR